jgi:Holliday junction resolvase
MSQYRYGRRKELQVGEFLERRGFNWKRAAGSKGSIDLVAWKGRVRLGIQIKATRKDYISYTRMDIDSEQRLMRDAKSLKVNPMLSLVSKNYAWFITVPDGKLLLEGELKSLKYDYEER